MKKTLFLASLLLGLVCCKSNHDTIVDLDSTHQNNLKSTELATGWYHLTNDKSGFERKLSRTEDTYFIDPKPIAVAANIAEIELVVNSPEEMYVVMQFGEQGTEKWAIATKEATGRHLAFVVDNELLSVPRVNHQLTGGDSAFGWVGYTKEEYEKIIKQINKNR